MARERVIPESFGSVTWDCEASIYPDTVRVIMADGRVLMYRRVLSLPRPHLADGFRFDQPKKHEKKGPAMLQHQPVEE